MGPQKTNSYLVVSLVTLMMACGGGSNPVAPPITQPPEPARASITVTQVGTAQVCLSPRPGFQIRVKFSATARETAGLGAFLNFIRFSLLKANGTVVESQDIGANQVAAVFGTNRLPPNGTQSATMSFDFNAGGDDYDGVRIEFNFTDDHQNVHSILLPGLNPVVGVLFCS